jgi:hypothetical protein
VRPILKIPNIKKKKKNRDVGVAQVVEHLPSKTEALSSNPSIIKKLNRERKQIRQYVSCIKKEHI